jgi:hypothetical protein
MQSYMSLSVVKLSVKWSEIKSIRKPLGMRLSIHLCCVPSGNQMLTSARGLVENCKIVWSID